MTMADNSNVQHYDKVAITLHWLVAIGVFVMIGLGWYMTDIPKGTPDRAFWFNLHKSIGVTLGVLVLIRLWWRLTHKPHTETHPLGAKMLAHPQRHAHHHAARRQRVVGNPVDELTQLFLERGHIQFFGNVL